MKRNEKLVSVEPKNIICEDMKSTENRKMKVNVTICLGSHDIFGMRQDRGKWRI